MFARPIVVFIIKLYFISGRSFIVNPILICSEMLQVENFHLILLVVLMSMSL